MALICLPTSDARNARKCSLFFGESLCCRFSFCFTVALFGGSCGCATKILHFWSSVAYWLLFVHIHYFILCTFRCHNAIMIVLCLCLFHGAEATANSFC